MKRINFVKDNNFYIVYNHLEEILGWIEYDKYWKTWIFVPNLIIESHPVFTWECMNDIKNFLKKIKNI